MKKESGIARCGLACCLCSENKHCNGYYSDESDGAKWCENLRMIRDMLESKKILCL